jgi:hypothetical protein
MMKNKFLFSAAIAMSLASCISDYEDAQTQPENPTPMPPDPTFVHQLDINDSPVYINEVDGDFWFSEDISLTQEQFEQLYEQSDPATRSLVTKSVAKIWPKGVVYYRMPEIGTMNAGMQQTYAKNVKKAIDMISSKTNIKFVQQTNQREYLVFIYAGGNSSPLGWTQNKTNTIRMYNIESAGIIAHEILHSLGVYHEQSRPDRDKHIIFYPERVDPKHRFNYNIAWSAQMSGPLDFGSIMMYPSDGFAISNKLPCMTKLDGSWIRAQRSALTAGDYAGLNELYNSSVTGQDQKPDAKPTPSPTPAPAPTPAPTPAPGKNDTWDGSKAYKTGDKVVYNGLTYEAKWWIKGSAPDSSDAWRLISSGAPVAWNSGKAYTSGSVVMHNDKKYKAKWWTRGDVPGKAGVWQAI